MNIFLRPTPFAARIFISCILAVAFLMPSESYAHAKLVKSDPGRRAIIKTAPKEIRLWFNEKLEPAYSTAVLLDDKDKPVATGPAMISRDDPKRISLALDALAPGIYRVKYRVLSIDGHVVDSSFTFTLQAAR